VNIWFLLLAALLSRAVGVVSGRIRPRLAYAIGEITYPAATRCPAASQEARIPLVDSLSRPVAALPAAGALAYPRGGSL
jgi:hypothetical protein